MKNQNPLKMTIFGILVGLFMIVLAFFIFQEYSFIIGGCAVMVIGASLFHYGIKKEK